MATDNQSPPPLPEEQQTKDFATKAIDLLRSFASRSKAAGLLIAKQVARAKIKVMTLPRQSL
jgi:hypothetical protein